jgi:Spy/CpxP family protein refolding chaperone
VAIYPNQHESAEGVAEYAGKHGFTHLMLRDPDGAVARSFGAEVTPTFFLFDKTGYLRYRGNLGGLVAAMDAVLEGRDVAKATTLATGCTVKWPEAKVQTPEGGTYVGPEGERPPREVPREGPVDPEPPALSQDARKWLKKTIKALGSEDPLVVRSASAAIMSFGPPAMPHLREALDAMEEGPARERLGRLVRQLGAMRRPGAGAAAGPGQPGGRRPGGRFRGSFLDRQREWLTNAVELTEEQQKQVDELYAGLKKREEELRKMAEGGDREGMREGFRTLMMDAQAGLAEILTEEQRQKLEEARRGMRGGGRRGPGGRRERDRDR